LVNAFTAIACCIIFQLLNGQLVDESLMNMIEQLGVNDMDAMQKNFAAVENCAGIRILY
jgi:hypothetical protein